MDRIALIVQYAQSPSRMLPLVVYEGPDNNEKLYDHFCPIIDRLYELETFSIDPVTGEPFKNIFVIVGDLKGQSEALESSGFRANYLHPFSDQSRDILLSAEKGKTPLHVIHTITKTDATAKSLSNQIVDALFVNNE